MADDRGEKTEQPTQRRMEEALRRGEIPISSEVQTALVLVSLLAGLTFSGRALWNGLLVALIGALGHLHEYTLTADTLQHDAARALLNLGILVGPIVLAIGIGGLLAGGLQSRFQTFSEALRADWERVNPVEGFSRLFSFRSAVPTVIALVKLTVVIALTYGQVARVLEDPIFNSTVNAARIADFLTQTALGITLRVTVALCVIASADYGYQFWRNRQDLMMTRDEVAEEQKNTEGNPQIKAAMRRRRQRQSQRKMLQEVPKADVVVTNPTHFAVALRYDRKAMKAPLVVAKGSRLNALRIKEIAKRHQVPVIENKPLARLLFKHARVGGEIPAQFYAAVAELLAYVYRVNRYRYYTQQNRREP
jgi:flagellar biosynthetic protein FlhB